MKSQLLDNVKKQFVERKINKEEYIKLPKSISKGNVLRISGYGDLEEDYFQHGFLYMQEGSEINSHLYFNNIELYRLISGDIKINEKTCLLGEKYGIKNVDCDTILEYFEVNRKICGHINNYLILNNLLQKALENHYNELNEVIYKILFKEISESDDINLLNYIRNIYFEEEPQKRKKLSH